MNIAPRLVRQAMVKEIAEVGQKAIEASTLAIDLRHPWCAYAVQYGRAAGANVIDTDMGEIGELKEDNIGYKFVHDEPRAVAQGALFVLEHIRAAVVL